ncbi:MAG: hypothetical protein K2Y39_16535 [Candidatus Obscuribacterales bacterium]|nr:hypothetical protein [Candidatus Obscuribacterales bacterium]
MKFEDMQDYTAAAQKMAHAGNLLARSLTTVFMLSLVGIPSSFSYPILGDTPSLRDMQQYHNSQPQHHDSQLYDSQTRSPSNTNGRPAIHRSHPAPDKTSWRQMYNSVGLEKQHKQNAPGSTMGNEGWQNVSDAHAPAYTPEPLRNGDFSGMMKHWIDAALSIGGSPQAAAATAVANMQAQEQGIANAAGKGTLEALKEILAYLAGGNINVANEAAGRPVNMKAPFRHVAEALWMVQRMFHVVYMPIALLLLLPGAVLLNLKVMCGQGMGLPGDEDSAAGPFSAILRTIIAVFLIPCTQLIMSYSIDIGNSLSGEVAKQIPMDEIYQWAKGQYDHENAQAAAAQAANGNQHLDPRPYKDQTFNMFLKMINMSLGYGLLIVMAFQTVISSYLLLLGPIAAAFFTWPGGVGRLFRPVFANWVDAVVNISLWRFWWCLLVLCAVTRIQWLKQIGEYVPNTEWEGLMLTCFLVLMSYVPFMPFEMRPGELVEKLLDKAKEASGNAGGRGGGGQQHQPGAPPTAPSTAA